METEVGGLISLSRRATILKYNGDGTVVIRLDDASTLKDDQNTHTVDLPISYADGLGALIIGYPEVGTPINVEQAQGEWRINGFVKPDHVFANDGTLQGALFEESSGDLVEEFNPGSILLQTSGKANRLLLNRDEGILIGTAKSSEHLDPRRSIISHNYPAEYAFTSAHRQISSVVKRDLEPNSIRNIEGSILDDHTYDDSLTTIGMDPEQIVAPRTSSGTVRNLPLVEHRELIYELENTDPTLNFSTDREESEKYDLSFTSYSNDKVLRTQSRTNVFNLNLYTPNHLLEEIKGTGVDIFGNILDINRAALVIGKDKASFIDNENLVDAFKNIRAEHRKSLAYHFEVNARKQQVENEIFEVPPSSEIENNMGRFLSNFFVDIDKEGQFKVNVPSSSETGNIPLPVRYINHSVLAYEDDQISDPNLLTQEDEFLDIFLQDFSVAGRFPPKSVYQDIPGITLVGDEGDVGPIDTIKKEPIKLNTPYHNILDAGFVFTKEWQKRTKEAEINTPVDAGIVRRPVGSRLNSTEQGYGDKIQLEDIVSKEIKISGDGANAGGRSGSMNLDGSLQLGIGANTVDRQSLWLDTAGGIISTIGRDRRGVSYCANLDGDMLVQIGGVGVGSATDSRFSNENDAIRQGALDIRVLKDDGQLTVVRIDAQGVIVTTFGRLTLESQQDMTLRARGQLNLEGEMINMFEGVSKRSVKRNGSIEI
jgi:hypothetical protein